MKRALCLLVLLAAPAAARAQEESVESELDFVRKLRGRYPELAREYLDKMQKRNDPKLAGILPLEQARTVLAVARDKDADQRFGLFNTVRDLLKDYVAKNAGKPEAAQGTLELARLSTYEGQALLTKALRELDSAAQQELAKPAEGKFAQAGKDLDAAIKILEELVANYKDADPKAEAKVKQHLKEDLTQAKFDRAINYINQARTYIETSKEAVLERRVGIITKAKDAFEPLAEEEDKATAYLAGAWLMKISMEQQAPDRTNKLHDRVMGTKEPAARAAQRWVRYFNMQDMLKSPINPKTNKMKDPIQKLKAVELEGVTWLKDYPNFIKAPEGQAVLWELADAYVQEAAYHSAGKESKKEAKVIAELKDKSFKYYTQLSHIEGDYNERANQIVLAMSFERMGERKEFRTFDELYLKAQFEMVKMRQLAQKKSDPKLDKGEVEKLEQEWKNKLKDVTKALSKAIGLATNKTPIQKLDEARYYLCASYLLSGDMDRAAVAGEALGRTRPPTRRAPTGAGYAIDAYANLLQRDNNDDTRTRLRTLAEYVLLPDNQKFWGTDPVTGVARFQLAMMLEKDKDFKGAVEQLEKVPPEFPAYIYSQGQLVFIAQEARAKEDADAADKKAFTEAAKRTIGRLPAKLPKDADPSTARVYYLAKLEMPKFLYSDGFTELDDSQPIKAEQKFKAMSKYIADLREELDKHPVKLMPENKANIELQMNVLQKYADFGLVEVAFREQQFDKVFDFAKPVVEAVKKLDDGKGGDIKMKDYKVTGDVVGLALRAHVQRGQKEDIPEAKTLLGLLKRLKGAEGGEIGDGASANVVRRLLQDIAVQIKVMTDKKQDEKLKSMVGSFGGFIDELVKEYDVKKMTAQDFLMLGSAYASLKLHDKAATFYGKVPAPKILDTKTPLKDLKQPEQEEIAMYWNLQLQQAKEWRAAKEFKKTHAVLDRMLKHPNAVFQLYAEKEKNFTLEEEKLYGAALLRWNAYMKNPGLQNFQNPKAKEQYFEGLFHQIRCMYWYSQHDTKAKANPKAVEKILNTCAKQIVRMETSPNQEGWKLVGDQFRRLLDAEPVLRAEYEKEKKTVAAPK